MAAGDIHAMRQGLALVGAGDSDVERIRDLPGDTILRLKVTRARNYGRLSRAHKLIELAFTYWEPDSVVSRAERHAIERLTRLHIEGGMPPAQAEAVASHYLAHLEASRETLDIDKNIEQFRADMTVEAGYFHVRQTLSGVRRVPMSWSYAATDEATFQQFYRHLFNACWRVCLSRTFEDEAQAQQAVARFRSFE